MHIAKIYTETNVHHFSSLLLGIALLGFVLLPAGFAHAQGVTISDTTGGATEVYAVDADGDADIDVFASGIDGTVDYFENTGFGSFTGQTIAMPSSGVFSIYAADLNGNGLPDAIAAYEGTVAYYPNSENGGFGAAQVITDTLATENHIYAADLDGDTDIDLLATDFSDDEVIFYENDGSGNFSLGETITSSADRPTGLHAADLGNDGDIDVFSASFNDNTIAYYENSGSVTGSSQDDRFEPAQIITSSAGGATSVYATDVTGNGNLDVLSGSSIDATVSYYENNGSGSFSLGETISTNASGASSIHAADIDNDGDIDVLAAANAVDKVAFYTNSGSASGSSQGDRFEPEGIVTTNADDVRSVFAADVNGDDLTDVLSASRNDNTVAYYNNSILPVETTTGMKEALILKPASPNPFRAKATVRFAAQESRPVRVDLFNTLGRRVTTLYEGTPLAGQTQQVTIDGRDLASGLYLVRLQSANRIETRQVTLLR